MAAATPGRASASASEVVTCAIPYFFATSRVGSSSRPTRESTSIPPMVLIASRCFWPKAPAPARMIFISRILQDDVAHGRVGGGHVVETVYGAHLGCERAAHDEPHH